MTANEPPELVPVEQVDRDAAAAMLVAGEYALASQLDDLRSGDDDDDPVVQAFARHRINASRPDGEGVDWCLNMARQEGDASIGAGLLALDPFADGAAPDSIEVVMAAAQDLQSLLDLKGTDEFAQALDDSQFWRDVRIVVKAAFLPPVSRQPAPPVEVADLCARLRRLRDFLNGERDLDGTWFGDDPAPGVKGARFWWRKMMCRDVDAAIAALAKPDSRRGSL